MGQIEEALRKAKEMQARMTAVPTSSRASARSNKDRRRTEGAVPFESGLAAKVDKIKLDPDAMDRSRVVTGLEK